MKRIAAAVVLRAGPNFTEVIETGGRRAITLNRYANRKGREVGTLEVALTLGMNGDGGAHNARRLSSDTPLAAGATTTTTREGP